ncbi:hypothetical protein [Vallitalea guaymasensis]|uniref:hypothetical protein n=1 Tax=Vallitalea guaymasensis TaxID=1185412 RepID=UPI000DE46D6A|nr:hypothetical protein [Vallitalea guaymasensis]
MNYSDEMKEVLMHYRKKGLSFELAIQSFEESINQFMPIAIGEPTNERVIIGRKNVPKGDEFTE